MKQYRKKPVVIEAAQWSPDDQDGPSFAAEHGLDVNGLGMPFIETLEGRLLMSRGDWLITGVKGEKYPCKPDIFEATYEAVE